MAVLIAPNDADPQHVTELLEAAGRGDQYAWEEIVRRYSRLVAAVIRSFRLQEADCRDAEQRTWLRLLEHRSEVRDPEHLGGWLATTAARECLRILRESRRTAAVADLDVSSGAVDDVEQQVVDADTAARLWRIVTALPPRRRVVVEALFAGEPRPYAEISRATGIPIGSLGPTRARILEQLRATLDRSPAPVRAP